MTNNTCFVICPLGERDSEQRRQSDRIMKNIIGPAVRANGLEPLRSDDIPGGSMITTDIIRHILNDVMVIADLTDHNANVFYELALRHAFRRPVVQMISRGQKLPFDVGQIRTVHFELDLDNAPAAAEELSRQIRASLARDGEPESPVSLAIALEQLAESKSKDPTEALLKAVFDQVEGLSKAVAGLQEQVAGPDGHTHVPTYIRDQVQTLLGRYSDELDLLKAVQRAGVIGIHKRRESALKEFEEHLDKEDKEIRIIGSSLKGLLQKEECKEIAETLQVKVKLGCQVKFLLTHPIFADLRASQENRRPTVIGKEIIDTLRLLKSWGVDSKNVRLYLGTPTCFAIKTTRHMLVNPYPYMAVSYDSPCLILQHSEHVGSEQSDYFFDEFDSRHFAAWDTELAVHIDEFDRVIEHCSTHLQSYSERVANLIGEGTAVQADPRFLRT